MFFFKLDFDLIIVQNAQFSSKEAQLRSIEAQLLFSYSQKSLRFPQKTLIHSQERFKVRVFASNGFAMLACWSFPLRSKCLGFLRPCWPWYENGSNSHKHATTGNRPRVFKRTQNVTSNNVGSCWPFARGLRLQTDETGFHQLDYQYG